MNAFSADLMRAFGSVRQRTVVPTPVAQPTAEEYRRLVARQEVPVAPAYRPTTRAVIDDVCLKHAIDRRDLLGPRRFRPFVAARNEAAYRLRQETSLSLPQIGRLLGSRDHTTIVHAVRRHAETLAREARRGPH